MKISKLTLLIRQYCFLLVVIIFLQDIAYSQPTEIIKDFKTYYDKYQVDGTFVLYDKNADEYIIYNKEQYERHFTPASTFKICNTLIGLETGVIPDEKYVIPWDSVMRSYPPWNKDNDLKNAYKNSTVWYYQELARRVGGYRMKHWLDSAQYGNADTTGGIDLFWLKGGLRITPKEQIDFLISLNTNTLPFSQRSVDIVKDIMIERDTLGYILRGKTGWGSQGNEDIGWFVGYVEANNNVYYFANCVQLPGELIENIERRNSFIQSRREITYDLLKELAIIQ